ncbi:type IVB secretion system protein IcmH/DotU [uncultured Cohaesibacter sp.]|uniref:type IVB secretion system protein IcmH/DotU n=1 Tax=uncultured Cohaesibacter sp. TaxID=1002546 RepID=UPI0029C70FC1|nr:type IVB secretion system protein IcmH/DotU [uncultured Cohaesibacter sp.]
MSGEEDDFEQPTRFDWLSPRARTSLAQNDANGDEPPILVQSEPRAPKAPAAIEGGVLQNAANIVQKLDTLPERTLVRLAAPILIIVAQLRNSEEEADVTALRHQVVEEIDRFQTAAQAAGCETGDIIAARYILCATVDETVLMKPWGSRSVWSSNSLINQYHNETWGGEKVFVILDKLRKDARKKLPVLILLHACLMLGFEGRFRVQQDGRNQLEDLRNELSKIIKRNSQIETTEPLARLTTAAIGGRHMRSFLSMWMVVGLAVVALLFVHFYAEFVLSAALEPAANEIRSLVNG